MDDGLQPNKSIWPQSIRNENGTPYSVSTSLTDSHALQYLLAIKDDEWSEKSAYSKPADDNLPSKNRDQE